MSDATSDAALAALETECLRALSTVRKIHTMAAHGAQPEPVAAETRALHTCLSRVKELSAPTDSVIVPQRVLERIDDDTDGAQGPSEWVADLEAAGAAAEAFSSRLSASLETEAAALEALAAAVAPESPSQ